MSVRSPEARPAGNRFLIVLSFIAIYFIWGSTYLAIRFAVETIPPWMMAATRFGVAGLIMMPFSLLRREAALSQTEKVYACKTGVFLLMATSTICYVEKFVASGVVAVIAGSMPIWIMLLGHFIFRRERVSFTKYVGAFIGLCGVAIIAFSEKTSSESGAGRYILILVIFATLIWAFGTQLQKNMGASKSPLRYSGLQMLAGAVASGLVSLSLGEWKFHVAQMSHASLMAWLYLVVFGSVLGFTAYSYLTQVVEPHILSSYALVNPVVAVILGSWLAHETISPGFAWASGLVIVGLIFLIYDRPLFKRAGS